MIWFTDFQIDEFHIVSRCITSSERCRGFCVACLPFSPPSVFRVTTWFPRKHWSLGWKNRWSDLMGMHVLFAETTWRKQPTREHDFFRFKHWPKPIPKPTKMCSCPELCFKKVILFQEKKVVGSSPTPALFSSPWLDGRRRRFLSSTGVNPLGRRGRK